PPRARRHDGAEGDDHQRGDHEEHAGVHAAQEEDAHRDDRDHHEGAHVGLGHHEHADHDNRYAHRQHGAEEALLDLHLANHVAGGIEDHRELGQLGGLEAHEAEWQPAARAVDVDAD